MAEEKKRYGVVWQLKQNIQNKEAILKALNEDSEKLFKKIAETREELDELNLALTLCEKGGIKP